MATQRFDIVDGPNRETLFDALRLIVEKRPITITWIRPDEEREDSKILLNGIRAENGNGEGWIISGYDTEMSGDNNVEFYLNTKSRTGWIKFCTGK